MRKSDTGVFLPSIKSQRASLSGRTKMKSFFLERVKEEVGEQATYEVMESSMLGEEQRKLKKLLREFNDRSQNILSDYIAWPVSKNEASPPRQSYDDVRKLLQREQEILSKITEQCQTQLSILDVRCENLKYTTRQEMEKQIREVKQQIEQLKTSNKNLGRNVTLNGLSICRGEPFDLVKTMEIQKIKVDEKLLQLQKQEESVKNQVEGLRAKTVQVEQDISKSQPDYRSAMGHKEEAEYLQKLKEQAKEKKKQIEYQRTKNEQVAGALKQRYLTKLKELDQKSSEEKKMVDLLYRKGEEMGKARKDLIVLEHQWSALKQKVNTVQLLNRK